MAKVCGQHTNSVRVQQMSKFNEHEAQVLLVWIATVTGEPIDTSGNAANFAQQLKDGVLLCK